LRISLLPTFSIGDGREDIRRAILTQEPDT